MTQEQKQVALAEAHGWKWYRWGTHPNAPLLLCTPNHDWSKGSFVPATRKPDEPFRSDNLPDYFNDLNAVHELEKVMANEQWPIYAAMFAPPDDYPWRLLSRPLLHATAAQRAEALGKTLGRWT
jgi:hypothetical protein